MSLSCQSSAVPVKNNEIEKYFCGIAWQGISDECSRLEITLYAERVSRCQVHVDDQFVGKKMLILIAEKH